MVRNIYDDWIPEEMDSDVVQRVRQVSAVEKLASPETMTSDTKQVPRSAGVDVEVIPKGGTYGEDVSANTDVTLIARKFGKAIRIAEEDVNDTLANLVAAKQRDWATSYAKMLDNAALAVVGAENGTTRPFTSVYQALVTVDAETGYAANANHTSLSLAGAATTRYPGFSTALGKVEQTDYFDLPEMEVVAHPVFRDLMRNALDGQSRPIFIQGHAGPEGRTPDTLFGLPVSWSLGMRVSATATQAPAVGAGVKGTAGNALMLFVNANYLRLGRRSGPETVFIDGRAGLGALTDESILKMRSRRGFALGHPQAASVLELIT